MSSSYSEILDDMLSDIDDKYDKSKGSFIYDILKAAAIKFEQFDASIDTMVDRRFGTTATGKYLEYIALDRGVTPKTSTKSSGIVTVTGSVGASIVKGQQVGTDTLTFVFTEDNTIPSAGTIDVEVECETYGSVGNVPVGAIKYFPVTLAGLTSVTNSEAFTNGYDGEEEEELRTRYFEKVQEPITSGNANEYKAWAKEVTGVGDAKVFPLWNGNGTVKIVIIDENKTGADEELINEVAEYIESQRPIGATVTVKSAVQKDITITVDVSISSDVILNNVQAEFSELVTDYLKTNAFNSNYISIAKIGNLLLSTTGVLDYTNLKINSGAGNINLGDEEVAVLGKVTIGVM